MGNNNRQNNALCAGCMRTVKWVPVLLIASIIVWSYYAYVIQLCILSIDNLFQKAVLLIFYHILCVLFFWSYWNTIFTPVGTIPARWRVPFSEIEKLERAESVDQQKRILEYFAKDLPVYNRTPNGCIRFCDKCKIIKPDRAHHCSVCGTCVLKMDHHCPWVNNCVNFKNYKYFVLFLGYSLLYCIYVALTSLEYFIKFWEGQLNGGMGRFHILFLFFLAVMFAISLVSLFGYHLYLVFLNRTTLEAFRAPIFRVGGQDKNGYNIGKFANFQEVFGDNWKYWLLPVFTSRGDGFRYPMQSQHQNTSYESMGDTPTRLDESTDKFLINSIHNDPDHNNTIIHFNNKISTQPTTITTTPMLLLSSSSSSSSSMTINNNHSNNLNDTETNMISKQLTVQSPQSSVMQQLSSSSSSSSSKQHESHQLPQQNEHQLQQQHQQQQQQQQQQHNLQKHNNLINNDVVWATVKQNNKNINNNNAITASSTTSTSSFVDRKCYDNTANTSVVNV